MNPLLINVHVANTDAHIFIIYFIKQNITRKNQLHKKQKIQVPNTKPGTQAPSNLKMEK